MREWVQYSTASFVSEQFDVKTVAIRLKVVILEAEMVLILQYFKYDRAAEHSLAVSQNQYSKESKGNSIARSWNQATGRGGLCTQSSTQTTKKRSLLRRNVDTGCLPSGTPNSVSRMAEGN